MNNHNNSIQKHEECKNNHYCYMHKYIMVSICINMNTYKHKRMRYLSHRSPHLHAI